MGWFDRFKRQRDEYRPGECLPEPECLTATGRKLYTVRQIRAAYAQGASNSHSLLMRALNLLSHPTHWHATPEHGDERKALSAEIAEHLNGLENCEAWTEREKRLLREQMRRGAAR